MAMTATAGTGRGLHRMHLDPVPSLIRYELRSESMSSDFFWLE